MLPRDSMASGSTVELLTCVQRASSQLATTFPDGVPQAPNDGHALFCEVFHSSLLAFEEHSSKRRVTHARTAAEHHVVVVVARGR